MKLRGVGKVVFQWIRGLSLGRNGGLWCWEFWRRWCWVAAVGFRWLGVISGMNWPWNGASVLLEDRVRLGDEFGTGLKELEGLDCWKGRGGRSLIFCKGRGGVEALLLSGCSLSQGDKGGEGGELELVLSRAGTELARCGF